MPESKNWDIVSVCGEYALQHIPTTGRCILITEPVVTGPGHGTAPTVEMVKRAIEINELIEVILYAHDFFDLSPYFETLFRIRINYALIKDAKRVLVEKIIELSKKEIQAHHSG